MNLCLFFEGTGRGVAGKITNVTRLRDICVDDARQKRLWGAFDRIRRTLPRIRLHFACKGL